MKKVLLFCLIVVMASASALDTLANNLNNEAEKNKATSITDYYTTDAPSPSPTPFPDLPSVLLNFTINHKNGTNCALFSFFGAITIVSNNKTDGIKPKTIHLDKNTSMDNTFSACYESNVTLNLNVNGDHQTQLEFKFNHTRGKYQLVYLQYKNTEAAYKIEDKLISIPDTRSYYCLSNQEFELKDAEANEHVVLSLSSLKIDAFRNGQTDKDFRQFEQCQLDFPKNDFVPLAVGCALISLVFVVLISYIIGRRRSRRMTYQSV